MPASPPQASWLWKIRERWFRDAFDATIALRLDEWELISGDDLAQTAGWAREAATTHDEEFGFVVLDGLMRLLSATAGDPPVDAAMVATARAYLSKAPDDELAAASEPLIRWLVPNLDGLLENIRAELGDVARAQSRRVLGAIALRLAVPRVELLRLAGRLSRVPDGAADPFGDALQAAFDCARTDPPRSESLLLRALESAASVPGDRFLVVRTLLHRLAGGLAPGTLRECARQLRDLAAAPLDGDQVAREVGRAAMQASAAGLAAELLPDLAVADEMVLAGELSAVGRVIHGLELAQWWLRVGRADRCDLALARLREKSGAVPAVVLGSARIEAQIRRQSGDRSGGRRRLAEALAATDGRPATEIDRAQAIIALIACWPVTPGAPDRPFYPEDVPVGGRELPGWCAEAQRCIGAVPPWAQNNLRVSLLAVLHGIGAADEAKALSTVTDLAAFRSQSADYSEWSADIEAWMERRSADEQGTEPPSGAAGQTYAELAQAGQIPEAAAAADALAEVQEHRGFRVDAYDTLIWSARLHTMTRDFAAALGAYEHAFALLEYDLQFVPYAELVVGRLAAWPDLYQQAAVTALLAGEPARALSLAETGRARATSGRLGRAHAAPPAIVTEATGPATVTEATGPATVTEATGPATVTEADWRQFAQLWRRAVAKAAGDLLAAEEPAQDGGELAQAAGEPGGAEGEPGARRAEAAAGTADLNRMRRAFLAAGVRPEDLAPVAPPVDVTGLPARLVRAQRPTAVLYPIQIHKLADPGRGTIRFVRVAASGITEMAVDPVARAEIARVIDQFGADVRAAPADADASSSLEGRLAGLVRDLGPHLEPVLSQAVAGIEDGRLIWIPPGVAAAVPIQALPCRGGPLIDLVSVIVAPSLRSVADTAVQDVVQPLRPAVIEGTAGPGQALTAGGDRVVLDGSRAPSVTQPASLAELNKAVERCTLVYLSCHGHFRWAAPLTSTLQLGADPQHRFDLPVADIFDGAELPADALVLLGACDSGTMAQTSLNEGIGVPAAFLAAGTRAVIGAGWPVDRAVAVGVCLKFMQALRDGSASPEALRLAVRWIRDATIADLYRELAAVGHPLYRGGPETEAQAVLRRRRAFAGLSSWAAYLHWGGGWRAEPPGPDEPSPAQT